MCTYIYVYLSLSLSISLSMYIYIYIYIYIHLVVPRPSLPPHKMQPASRASSHHAGSSVIRQGFLVHYR